MQKGKQSWQPEQKSRQCVTQRKTQKRKRADLSQHRRGSVRQEKWFPERKAVGQERKHRIVPEIRGSLHSSRFHTMRWEGTVSAGCRTSFIPRRSVFYDINYQLAQNEDKNAIFENWCDFLNYFDSTIHFQLSFINQHSNMAEYEKVIHINPQEDAFDDLRMEFAQMLNNQLAKEITG